MIIIASLFLILLMLVTASWFIIPLYIFGVGLYHDITQSLRWGKSFPLGTILISALGVFIAFCFSAFATLGLIYELHSLWVPEKTRNVLIQVPEKVQIHTEFRLNDTVIGKEIL